MIANWFATQILSEAIMSMGLLIIYLYVFIQRNPYKIQELNTSETIAYISLYCGYSRQAYVSGFGYATCIIIIFIANG